MRTTKLKTDSGWFPVSSEGPTQWSYVYAEGPINTVFALGVDPEARTFSTLGVVFR